ncbi:histidine phosphatase family protein [Kroppenstedtia pulmonis]|uniref:Histidine phosphatase family protein n=1 Tax=Kroppenstedtia pulmonis TaxID=1380685 RepID=A0A7D4BI28_9BACL|nr:histidine phosphatase family protein [Kroppenstedtia pulmonis]QKG85035.1 histidine phosphatase family protein [Kroppenstedtia pulmonis]
MTRFYLLRHGETAWNRDGDRYCGRSDISLTDQGIRQAEQVGHYLSHYELDAVYASPLSRARQTAEAVALPHGLKVSTDHRLVEMDFGNWEGLTKPQIHELEGDDWYNWTQNPVDIPAGHTGETADQVYNRVKECLKELSKRHPNQTVAVVAHNTVNRIWTVGSLRAPFASYRYLRFHNTGISVFEWERDAVFWRQMNSTDHLRN